MSPASAMYVVLEVTYDAGQGEELFVCGAEPSLGEWDPNRACRLVEREEAPASWRAEIPFPSGGAEFKLLLKKGSETVWEPLPDNRRFPSHGLGQGTVLRLQYGNPKISVEASAAQLEAMAKATRKLEDRQGSALQENVDRKGENAYYFAHTRKFEVPEHAKVITGPGLITGGAPVLLEATMMVDTPEEERTVWLKDYSWADSNGKVKVYVPVPEGVLPTEGADGIVETAFESTQVDLTIKSKPRQKLKIEKLNGELKVDACSARVEAHKNRIVLQLAKKRETTWYSLTKK